MLQHYMGYTTVLWTDHTHSKHIIEIQQCNGLWTSKSVEVILRKQVKALTSSRFG